VTSPRPSRARRLDGTRGALLLVALATVLSVTLALVAGNARPSSAAAGAAWLAYGRTADAGNVAATPITVAQAKRFKLTWKRSLGGIEYGQPLFVPAGAVPGVRQDIVIAATSSNVVYALAASTGNVLWKRSLGSTVPNICGGTGGIESTPVVDPSTGLLYVIGAAGRLRALSLATGQPDPKWSLPIITRTDVETVWGALRIVNGVLYVGVGSWCDKPDASGAWDGRLDAVDLATRRITHTFDVVPGPKNGGGIWGPGGVSVDPADGSIWVATANAVVEEDGNLHEQVPHAERVLNLTRSLAIRSEIVQPDSNPSVLGDQGFGSTPTLFQPTGCPPLVAVNSKDSYTYVWRRRALHSKALVRDLFGQRGANNTFFAEPTWDATAKMLVVDDAQVQGGDGSNGAVGLKLGAGCTFHIAWHINIGGGVDPQPLAAGPVVFAPATAAGQLAVLNASTGAIVSLLQTNGPAYTAPMIADGRVLVSSSSGTLLAFGDPAG
jgi:outer membrane protein assembly factor BamB